MNIPSEPTPPLLRTITNKPEEINQHVASHTAKYGCPSPSALTVMCGCGNTYVLLCDVCIRPLFVLAADGEVCPGISACLADPRFN